MLITKKTNIQEIETEVVELVQKRFLSKSIVNLSEDSKNAPESRKTASEQISLDPNVIIQERYCRSTV